jgi:hypothetical protein
VACAASLLATTQAGAVPIDEGAISNDLFGDTFATRTTLPGLSTAIGWASESLEGVDDFDYIGFAGLTPGAPFLLTATVIQSDAGLVGRLYDAAEQLLALGYVQGSGHFFQFTGIVPAGGELVFFAAAGEDFVHYLVSTAPEPAASVVGAASLLAGAGLAGSRLRRRSRR